MDRFCDNPKCIWHDSAPLPEMVVVKDDGERVRMKRELFRVQRFNEHSLSSRDVYVCSQCKEGFEFLSEVQKYF